MGFWSIYSWFKSNNSKMPNELLNDVVATVTSSWFARSAENIKQSYPSEALRQKVAKSITMIFPNEDVEDIMNKIYVKWGNSKRSYNEKLARYASYRVASSPTTPAVSKTPTVPLMNPVVPSTSSSIKTFTSELQLTPVDPITFLPLQPPLVGKRFEDATFEEWKKTYPQRKLQIKTFKFFKEFLDDHPQLKHWHGYKMLNYDAEKRLLELNNYDCKKMKEVAMKNLPR